MSTNAESLSAQNHLAVAGRKVDIWPGDRLAEFVNLGQLVTEALRVRDRLYLWPDGLSNASSDFRYAELGERALRAA